MKQLFGGTSPIGQVVRIQRVPFTVIGVLGEKGQTSWGRDLDDVVFMPLSTAKKRVLGGRQVRGNLVRNITVKAASAALVPVAEKDVADLLRRSGSVVVKPARGEQGRGVAVDLRDLDTVRTAIHTAASIHPSVIVETFHPGMDLRLVVIGFRMVAAAIRKPAEVIGDGRSTLLQLIERHSRRRGANPGFRWMRRPGAASSSRGTRSKTSRRKIR